MVGDGTTVPVVKDFKYLGSIITRDAKSEAGVESRVQKAGNAFGAMKDLIFKNPQIHEFARRLIYTTSIMPVLAAWFRMLVPHSKIVEQA